MIFSIIDYKLNNLNSVIAACHRVNIKTNIILKEITHLFMRLMLKLTLKIPSL